MTGTAGRLLVAEPMLGDPNFDRTVVLMLQHTAGGRARPRAQPADRRAGHRLPCPTGAASSPSRACSTSADRWRSRAAGAWPGPATSTRSTGFVPVRRRPRPGRPRARSRSRRRGVLGGAALRRLLRLGARPARARAGAGRVVRGRRRAGRSVPPRPARLWRRILARQGGPLARLALFPADPSLN